MRFAMLVIFLMLGSTALAVDKATKTAMDNFQKIYKKSKNYSELTIGMAPHLKKNYYEFLKGKSAEFPMSAPLPKLLRKGDDEFNFIDSEGILMWKAVDLRLGEFKVNGQMIQIARDATPESVWEKIAGALPKKTVSNYVFPEAQALIFETVVGLTFLAGGGLVLGHECLTIGQSNSLCQTTKHRVMQAGRNGYAAMQDSDVVIKIKGNMQTCLTALADYKNSPCGELAELSQCYAQLSEQAKIRGVDTTLRGTLEPETGDVSP